MIPYKPKIQTIMDLSEQDGRTENPYAEMLEQEIPEDNYSEESDADSVYREHNKGFS
jgi:hypothetical protein